MTPVKTEKKNESIRSQVQDAYAKRVTGGGGCCGGSDHGEAALKMGYSEEDLSAVPDGANLGLGCGAPLASAGLQPGETVLDLGSGAGFDAFIAAGMVGPEGRVIGVDMTPEMVAKATENAAKSGFENVEFRHGIIEEMPVESESVDVVISNCVINLAPDKEAVFREAFRVLRPGGRVAVSDIVLSAPLPEVIAESVAAYVGCVAGASLLDEYLGYARQAGFEEVEVVESRPAIQALPEDDPVVKSIVDGAGACCLDELAPLVQDVANQVLSAKVVARKPKS